MRHPRPIGRTAAILLLIVAVSLVLGVWAARPVRVYSELLKLVGPQDDAPTERLRRWAGGEFAPQTVSGLVSLFEWEEVAVGGTLLVALLALAILLATTWSDGRKGSLWATRLRAVRLPRVRFRVVTALALVAIVALELGWEVNSWRYWRLRQIYLRRANQYGTIVENGLDREQYFLQTVIALDRALSTPEARRRLTPEAEAAARALAADLYHKRQAPVAARVELARRLKAKYLHAADHPWEAVTPDPGLTEPEPDPESNTSLWIAHGDYTLALAAYDARLRLYPDHAETHGQRASLLAGCPDARYRDGRAAVISATRACELTRWADEHTLAILAAAHAKAGDFEAAIRWQETIVERADDQEMKADFESQLNLYRSGMPFRWQR